MNIEGKHYRTIWVKEGNEQVIQVIDQRHLPHQLVIEELKTVDEFIIAIKDMHIRGAGLIGAAAAYGMYIATLEAPGDELTDQFILEAGKKLKATRPTAVNLSWAIDKQLNAINKATTRQEKIAAAFKMAGEIAEADADACKKIGEHGVALIEAISKKKERGNSSYPYPLQCRMAGLCRLWFCYCCYICRS